MLAANTVVSIRTFRDFIDHLQTKRRARISPGRPNPNPPQEGLPAGET
jgi:hypothetical protein